MPFASALSTNSDAERAFREASERVRSVLSGPVDLAVLFFSPHHGDRVDDLARWAQETMHARALVGCPGEAIVGEGREIEQMPALALWAGQWPEQALVRPFHLEMEQTREGATLLGWPDELMEIEVGQAAMLVLADPFSFPVDEFLEQVDETHPGLPVLGGMSSGMRAPGECRLIVNERVVSEGAVCVLLGGGVRIRSMVSQGCRPIGQHYIVTGTQDQVITGLGGKSPLSQLQALWQEIGEEDRKLFQQGLHLGRVINEYQGAFRRGDFLVRNILGIHEQSGALAVADRLRVGQTVQFHVRDAASADEELRSLLQAERQRGEGPAAALLFTCNGRGTRLFGRPHHDAQAIVETLGPIPVAGFFAQGELGPIGNQNFIHGFTASLALFEGG